MASQRSYKRRLSKVRQGSIRRLWASNIWVGLLGFQKRQQSPEFGVDGQEWLYQTVENFLLRPTLPLTITPLPNYPSIKIMIILELSFRPFLHFTPQRKGGGCSFY